MNDLQKALSIIKDRRSIYPRYFTEEAVDDELFRHIIEVIRWAPTHRMTQPWRFKIFTGNAKHRLADFMAENYKSSVAPKSFSEKKYKERRKKVLRSSHVLLIAMARSEPEVIPEWEELAAVACAVENLWIAVTAAGLGGYWSSPAELIGKPPVVDWEENEKCYGIFYLGHHNMPDVPRHREPLDSFIEYYHT